MEQVFIVDDDEQVREAVGVVLKQAGYEVLKQPTVKKPLL